MSLYERYSQVQYLVAENDVWKLWFTWRTCYAYHISTRIRASYCIVPHHVLIFTWRLYAFCTSEKVWSRYFIRATRVPANVTDASDSSRTCRNCRRSPARCTSSRSFPARCTSSRSSTSPTVERAISSAPRATNLIVPHQRFRCRRHSLCFRHRHRRHFLCFRHRHCQYWTWGTSFPDTLDYESRW